MTRPTNLSYLPTARPADEEEAQGADATKRSLTRPLPPTPGRSDNLLDVRLSEEIDMLRRYLETAGYLLNQDAQMRYRYATELGNLKHVEKMLGHVARIVEAADKEGAIDRVADADMRARLRRRPITPWYESKH